MLMLHIPATLCHGPASPRTRVAIGCTDPASPCHSSTPHKHCCCQIRASASWRRMALPARSNGSKGRQEKWGTRCRGVPQGEGPRGLTDGVRSPVIRNSVMQTDYHRTIQCGCCFLGACECSRMVLFCLFCCCSPWPSYFYCACALICPPTPMSIPPTGTTVPPPPRGGGGLSPNDSSPHSWGGTEVT